MFTDVLGRHEEPLKNHSLFLAKKMWKRIPAPSNAVTLDLEEEVPLKHPSENKTRKKKGALR